MSMSDTQNASPEANEQNAEATREWLESFAEKLEIIENEEGLPEEMRNHFKKMRAAVSGYANKIQEDPKLASSGVEAQFRQHYAAITSYCKRIVDAQKEYNAIKETSAGLIQRNAAAVVKEVKDQSEELKAKAMEAEAAVQAAKEHYNALQKSKAASLDAIMPGLSQLMTATKDLADNAPVKAIEEQSDAKIELETLVKMRKALGLHQNLQDDKAKDPSEHLSGRERTSIDWINKQIEDDNKTGRLIKAVYNARLGWKRNRGIGRVTGLVGGIGGSVASDVHRSIRKWKTSGGLGKFLVGGALDFGMTAIKRRMDQSALKRLGASKKDLEKSERGLLDAQGKVDAATYSKLLEDHKRKLYIANEFRLNADTFGHHFLSQEYNKGQFETKDDLRKSERGSEYDALGKGFVQKDEKGRRQYIKTIFNVLNRKKPKMAGGGVAISQVDVTVGDAGAEGIVPLEGKGAKMVGEAVANAILTGTHKESSTGGKMESAEARDARQQEEEDRGKIADNTSKIVEMLDEESKKKRDGDKDKKGLIGMLLAALGGLAASLLGKLSGLFAGAGRMLAGLGGRILQPLAKFGSFLISSLKNVFRSLLSFFGIKLPEPPMPKPPVPTEPPVKPGEAKAKPGEAKAKPGEAKPGEKPKAAEAKPGEKPKPAEAKGKGKIARLKDAIKKGGGVKNMFKMGVRGLAKGLGAGIATELLIEGITRGSAHLMGLTEEERQKAREQREAMEVGYGRNDLYAGDLSAEEAEDARYEADKRTSEMWYRKRCEKLGVHHKTHQGEWFTSSKDYRQLTFEEIQNLGPRERKFFDEWLNSEEGKHKREVLQKQHPEAFGIKPTPQANPQAAAVQAKIAQMRERAKTAAKNGGVIPPTPEAPAAAAQMKGSNILPAAGAGLAAAGIAGAGLAGAGLAGAGLAAGAGLGKLALGAGGFAAAAAGMKAAIKDKDSGDQGPIDFENKLLKDLKEINNNIDLIRKMVAMIKIDGTPLGVLIGGEGGGGVGGAGGGGIQTPGQAAAGAQGAAYQGAAQAGGTPGDMAGGGASGDIRALGKGADPSALGHGKIGDAIAQFESGNKGVMKIGYDSGGGTSYGKWQLSSKQGSYKEWLDLLSSGQYGEKGKQISAKLRAAGAWNTGSRSGAAVTAYLEEAAQNRELFEESQRASYFKNQYSEAYKRIQSGSLKTMIQNDKGLQEMLFSTSVQHGQGGASRIFNAAFREGMSRDQLIDSVYAQRGKRGFHTRYADELKVIKAMSPTGGSSAGGSPGSVPVSNPNGGPAPAAQGPMTQLPMQQGAPVQGMPPMGGAPVAGLSQVYASLTADAKRRGVRYVWGGNDSRSGVDCSGWNREMQTKIMNSMADGQGKRNIAMILKHRTAAEMIHTGWDNFANARIQNFDPEKGPVKANMMIGIGARAGKHGTGSWGNIGHIVQTYKDPQTGELMVSESTSGKGVISTPYAKWWKSHQNRQLYGLDMDVIAAGQAPNPNAIPQSMEGAQQTQYGVGATAQSGAQIQQSQAGMAQQAAIQGAGGGNVVDASMNVMGGGGGQGAQGPGVTFVTNKDPMGWVVLQGNCVH